MLRIVVSLGTDHHRFDRLVDWLDDWVAEHAADVTVTLQHGHSRPSRYADNLEIVARDQLLAAMRGADVVITQAGPGSMVDAHDSGHLPVVVPRSAALHEVVDDHQSIFAELMERLGDCVVARDSSALRELLDRATNDAAFLLRAHRESPAAATAVAVREHLDRAVERGPGWVSLERLRDVAAPRRRMLQPVDAVDSRVAVAPGLQPLDAPAPDSQSSPASPVAPAGTVPPVRPGLDDLADAPAGGPARPTDRVAVLRFGSRPRARHRASRRHRPGPPIGPGPMADPDRSDLPG